MTFVSKNSISRPLRRISGSIKINLMFMLAAILLAAVFSLRPSFAQDAIVLVGSGSSVPAPLYNRWAAEYNKRNPALQFRYLPIGASEGIKQISKGSGDFGAGEVPLTTAERAEASLVELPSVMIAIVPYYHLPGPHQDLRFTGELLAEIFLGEIKKWNDPQIAKLNSNASLPDLPIKVFYSPRAKEQTTSSQTSSRRRVLNSARASEPACRPSLHRCQRLGRHSPHILGFQHGGIRPPASA